MKTITKIFISLVAILLAVMLPAILAAFMYIQLPGFVLAFLLAWMIYILIYVWRLPSCQVLTIKGYKDDKWGGRNANDVIGLKSELMKLTNPNNFMKPYSDKVPKAMELHNQLEDTDANDINKLSGIRIIAEYELEVSIDPTAFATHLLGVFSPVKYSRKPNIANELNRICSEIVKCGNDIVKIESVLTDSLNRIHDLNNQFPSYKLNIVLIFSFLALIYIIGFWYNAVF